MPGPYPIVGAPVTAIKPLFKTPKINTGIRPSADIEYYFFGSDDELVIQETMWGSSYASFEILGIGGVPFICPLRSIEMVEKIAPTVWRIRAHYELNITNPQTGQTEQTFEFGGGSQRILVAQYGQVGSYGTVPTGLDNSVGVSANGEVQGIELPPPDSIFTWTGYFSSVSPYTFQTMVNAVNSVSFKGHPPGQVRIMGISGQQRGWGDWQVGFRFGVKLNVGTAASIYYGPNNTLGPITCAGWDLIDVHTLMTLVGSGASARIKPVADFVRIMRWALFTDFAALGIDD
ncbi:MAG: hypothetical protein ABSF29_12635 [Tepidisphaeraceae bacterium]|jgi:hypothetical protein